MALILTRGGSIKATVTSDESMMRPTLVDFRISAVEYADMIATGALNLWQPVTCQIGDGNPDQGIIFGMRFDVAGYIVGHKRRGAEIDLTVADVSVLFDDLPVHAWTDAALPGAEHIASMLDRMGEDVVSHRPTRFDDSGADRVYQLPDGNVETQVPLLLRDSSQTIVYEGFEFSRVLESNDTINAVRFWLTHDVPDNLTDLDATVEVSVDGGSNWLPVTPHAITTNAGVSEFTGSYVRLIQAVDLTADTAWSVSALSDENLRIRIVWITDTSDTSRWWYHNDIRVEVSYTRADIPVPDITFAPDSDYGGKTVSLPLERKVMSEWLDQITHETNYEWRLFATDELGGAELIWLPRIGADVSGLIDLDAVEFASLETGTHFMVPDSSIDGRDIYTRVRVSLPGHADIVRTNWQALNYYRVLREKQVTLSETATVAEQIRTADDELARWSMPYLAFPLVVPRRPGLWMALEVGNTAFVRVRDTPVGPWQGWVRILGRKIDEAQGSMTINVVAIDEQKPAATVVAPAIPPPPPIRRPVTSVKQDPRKRLIDLIHEAIFGHK